MRKIYEKSDLDCVEFKKLEKLRSSTFWTGQPSKGNNLQICEPNNKNKLSKTSITLVKSL